MSLSINHEREDFDKLDKNKSTRIFKSDFLESFTHLSPALVLGIWIPLSLLLISLSIYLGLLTGRRMNLAFIAKFISFWVLGILAWTFLEYWLHRGVFHLKTKNRAVQRFVFIMHGHHHAEPMMKTRLVMPPVISLSVALVIFLILYYFMYIVSGQELWLLLCFYSGIASGYTIYDLMHWSQHHVNYRNPYLKWVRKHHMHHHVQSSDKRFGISNPFWDMIFGTYVWEKKKK